MLKSDLLEIIGSGESSGVDFKRDDVRPEDLAKEIVAMANLKGGRLLLGVEDDGRISGIQRENTEEWVMNVFSNKVHPMILPFYEEVAMDDGKRVAVVTFSEGPSKPYVLRHHGREDIYIRVGTTSRRATREQQARLHEMGGMIHSELLPASGASLSALDRQRVSDFLRHVARYESLPDSDDEWCDRLESLGFMASGPDGTPVCTITGLVLFGHTPRRFLKQAGLRIMVFDGTDKTYNAQLDKLLDGPVLPLWTDAEGEGRVRAAGGILDLADELLSPHISNETTEIQEGFERHPQPKFSREVIREVLLNAVAHRDWTRFNEIELVVYSDRLEVVSPGALPNMMTVEKMIAGQRSPRNPLLVDILRDYGFVDARGMGIRNKVIPLVREMCGREPVFEETEDFLKTTVPAAGVTHD